ncbi:uncharacterized protein LOC114260335 [Camellia sinensis]|uniref:uncharacterized protein LOC114260335 n=1 Tax=Camellia sinensis TaxID=4442 RepID=UPI0010357008|nr:uncharacterized protein LOC114260335 [Camellia sinensis]
MKLKVPDDLKPDYELDSHVGILGNFIIKVQPPTLIAFSLCKIFTLGCSIYSDYHPLLTQLPFPALPSTFSPPFTRGSIKRIRVVAKVISERIGSIGTTRYWIGCCMKDLRLFVFRSFGLEMKNLLTCMKGDLVILAILLSSLYGQFTHFKW